MVSRLNEHKLLTWLTTEEWERLTEGEVKRDGGNFNSQTTGKTEHDIDDIVWVETNQHNEDSSQTFDRS